MNATTSTAVAMATTTTTTSWQRKANFFQPHRCSLFTRFLFVRQIFICFSFPSSPFIHFDHFHFIHFVQHHSHSLSLYTSFFLPYYSVPFVSFALAVHKYRIFLCASWIFGSRHRPFNTYIYFGHLSYWSKTTQSRRSWNKSIWCHKSIQSCRIEYIHTMIRKRRRRRKKSISFHKYTGNRIPTLRIFFAIGSLIYIILLTN